MKHTKEPWKIGKNSSIVSDEINTRQMSQDSIDFYGGQVVCESVQPSDAKRIIDCVNALVGVEDPQKKGTISDGYHTFDELYDHRHALWIAVCRLVSTFRTRDVGPQGGQGYHITGGYRVIRSKMHGDGSMYEGHFILMLENIQNHKQMSYHLPERLWDKCEFAETLAMAPEWDGHTSEDVIRRLFEL